LKPASGGTIPSCHGYPCNRNPQAAGNRKRSHGNGQKDISNEKEDSTILGETARRGAAAMIRKLASGGYRLYSRKLNPKTGRRRNLGTFRTRTEAEKHERAVQYFKRH
jgi:hypothetical protein